MESIAESTKEIIEHTFHESPNYSEVFLNGVKFDARISVEEDEKRKTILFRPDTEIFKGDIIEAEDRHWLVNNTYDNSIYPTAFVDLCNEWLRWTDESGNMLVYPCVVSGKTIDLNEGKYLIYSENVVDILTPYNTDTMKIIPKQRFIFNGKAYQIEGVDAISEVSFGKGIVSMKATETLLEAEDNLDEEIADNNNEGWGDW
jgi:hypothetical protein